MPHEKNPDFFLVLASLLGNIISRGFPVWEMEIEGLELGYRI